MTTHWLCWHEKTRKKVLLSSLCMLRNLDHHCTYSKIMKLKEASFNQWIWLANIKKKHKKWCKIPRKKICFGAFYCSMIFVNNFVTPSHFWNFWGKFFRKNPLPFVQSWLWSRRAEVFCCYLFLDPSSVRTCLSASAWSSDGSQ